MSVPKSQRNQSVMEFYHNALNLRHEITALLLRDFGLKKKIRTVEILVKMYDIDPADKQTLTSILNKYKMKKKYYRLKNGNFLSLEHNEDIEFLNL